MNKFRKVRCTFRIHCILAWIAKGFHFKRNNNKIIKMSEDLLYFIQITQLEFIFYFFFLFLNRQPSTLLFHVMHINRNPKNWKLSVVLLCNKRTICISTYNDFEEVDKFLRHFFLNYRNPDRHTDIINCD